MSRLNLPSIAIAVVATLALAVPPLLAQTAIPVDVANATSTNTIGAPELGAIWTDPDFDVHEAAFYYARVIEIPTPRWIAHDALRFGVDLPEGANPVHQERGYTSPIWYDPS